MIVKYVSYYDVPENKAENRSYQMSAVNKINYVCKVLNRLGHNVQIISASVTENRKGCKRKTIPVFENTSLTLLPCLGMGSLPKRVVRRVLGRILLLSELLFYTRKGEPVLVYHALAYAGTIALARKIKKFRLILEVEEIYADVSGNEQDRSWEFRLFDVADAFLFPTELLNEKVNRKGKPYVISHGTYQVEPDRGVRRFQDEKVHCVYAGTFDPRKGGALAAAAAAQHLPENYHMHILGFGSDEEVTVMQKKIEELSKVCECGISYDGLLTGEDYIRFLQSCDIGLSTQNPEAAFNATSFPSKILSYMASGLQVVSIRIPAVEGSAVGDRVSYYDRQTPAEIARAILSASKTDLEDPRSTIEGLNRSFIKQMEELLGNA